MAIVFEWATGRVSLWDWLAGQAFPILSGTTRSLPGEASVTTPATGVTSLVGRLLLLGLAVVPPSVAAVSLWAWVRGHVIGAVLIVAGYEVLLLVGGFAGKVFGDLQDRWVKVTADWADETLRRTSARFQRDYRRQVRETVRFVDQKGFIIRGDAPELEHIYVDVSLESRPPREDAGGLVTDLPQVSNQRRSLRTFIQREKPAVLALIGAPGTGKTTLLRHTTLRMCSHRSSRRPLPVLLYLRDHAAAIVERPDIGLPEVIVTRLGHLREQEPPGWFDRQLRRGRFVIMLDGLDEVPREEHRQRVIDWVDQQIAEYHRNDFIITSRPYGYRQYPLNSAAVLQVQRFTPEQTVEFVRAWYRAADRLTDHAAQPRGRPEALLSQLRRNAHLYELAANPLLLTMIVNVHRIRGELPGTRAELYAEICRVVLWRHDYKRSAEPGDGSLDGERKERILRELAFTMMREGTRDLPRSQALDLIDAFLAPRPPDGPAGTSATSVASVPEPGPDLRAGAPAGEPATGTSANELLMDMGTSGLLLEREIGTYSFAHQTFQEYLAAAYIQDHPELESMLTGAVDDPWWRETTLLYVTRADPTGIVQACLASGSVPALALAFDCVDEGRPVSPDAQAALDRLLDEGSNASDERTRLLAAVTVTRHLREAVRVQEQTWVCARPITPEMYGRTGLATRAGALVWSGPTARNRGDADPVPGPLWPADVAALVDWVNALAPGGPTYRLPTVELTREPGFALVTAGDARPVWVASDASPPDLQVAGEVAHPFAATPEEVDDQVHTDLRNSKVRDATLIACLLYRTHLHNALSNDTIPFAAPFGDLYQLSEFAAHPRRALERDLVSDDLRGTDHLRARVDRFLTAEGHLLASNIGQVRSLVRHLTRDRDLARAGEVDLSGDRRRCLIGSMSIFLCCWLAAATPDSADEDRSTQASILQPPSKQATLSQLVRPFRPKTAVPPSTPDALLARIQAAVENLGQVVDADKANADLGMAYDVAQAMRTIACDSLGGSGRFDPDAVRCVRLGAMAVATAAARVLGTSDITRDFRATATGITALERRATDPARWRDAVILVRS